MAGNQRTRERLKEATAELDRLRALLDQHGIKATDTDAAETPAPGTPPGATTTPATPPQRPPRSIEPRTFSPDTRNDLIAEMLAMADDGATLDEVAAHWNVETADVLRWGEDDVSFATAIRRARTRARGAVAAMFRKALMGGRNLPGSLIEKLMALYPGEDDAGADASRLVRVFGLPPADPQSATPEPQASDEQGECVTSSVSHSASPA